MLIEQQRWAWSVGDVLSTLRYSSGSLRPYIAIFQLRNGIHRYSITLRTMGRVTANFSLGRYYVWSKSYCSWGKICISIQCLYLDSILYIQVKAFRETIVFKMPYLKYQY